MADNISGLNHPRIGLPNGGEVIALDTGALLDAESVAMLQALHSRSTGGFWKHMDILEKRGADDFIKNFYVGYGHKSIGDCGSTTLFIEGVSMLAAKAIQDNPLYSGQEASTRYIDFSEQPFIDPNKTTEGANILEAQRQFYLDAREPTLKHLRALHPIGKNEKEGIYEKAINARMFDITRSLLPSGASTNLAWHTNLRQAADHLLFLRHHPLGEVREIAGGIEEVLNRHHPNSFGHKRYPATEAYQDLIAANHYYHDANSPESPLIDFSNINDRELQLYKDLIEKRPPKTELPKFLASAGTMDVGFQLDFGSYRDIQRHRAISQRSPLLTTELGFNDWYVNSFPEEVREKLPEYLGNLKDKISGLGVSRENEQYFIPMGFNTANKFTGNIPATVYMVELRDSRFVHPTLQKVAHNIGEQITSELGIPLHVDSEPNRFDVKRGEHDIVLKK